MDVSEKALEISKWCVWLVSQVLMSSEFLPTTLHHRDMKQIITMLFTNLIHVGSWKMAPKGVHNSRPPNLWMFFYLLVNFICLAGSGPSCSLWDFCCACKPLSGCSIQAPECRLSSCIMWAELLHGMWDISSPTRDQIHVPCIGQWMFNYWTTREVPECLYDKREICRCD